jgi:hypothetical protein
MENIEAIDYLKCKKSLNNLGITDEEISRALNELGYNKENLCDTIALQENRQPYQKPFEFIRKGTSTFKEYTEVKGKEYIRDYTAPANFYRVSAQYQGLKHGTIIHKILSNRYNWFDSFYKNKSYQESETAEYFDTIGRLAVKKLPEKYLNMTVAELLSLKDGVKISKKESAWSLYEMHNEDYEIYLGTELGNLYVPIKAILNSNIELIKNRMTTYAMSYHDPKNLSGFALNHRGRTKEEYAADKQKDYENMIAPLNSKEAKLLFDFIAKIN